MKTYIPIHADGRLNEGQYKGMVFRISPVRNEPGDYYIFSGVGKLQHDNYVTGIENVVHALTHHGWTEIEWHGLSADRETIPRDIEQSLQAIIMEIDNQWENLHEHGEETIQVYLEGYSSGAVCALGLDKAAFNRLLTQALAAPRSSSPTMVELFSRSPAHKWVKAHDDAWNLVLADFYAKHTANSP